MGILVPILFLIVLYYLYKIFIYKDNSPENKDSNQQTGSSSDPYKEYYEYYDNDDLNGREGRDGSDFDPPL